MQSFESGSRPGDTQKAVPMVFDGWEFTPIRYVAHAAEGDEGPEAMRDLQATVPTECA